jgi:hypothetical protein
MLAGQLRNTTGARANPASYLEAENDYNLTAPDLFQLTAASAVFNDTGIHK